MDSVGNWPKLSTIFTAVAVAAVVVAAAAATVATCGAAAPLLAVVGGQVSAGVVATAASITTGAITVAGASAAAAVTTAAVEEVVEKATNRNNSVYVLKDSDGTVQYVGRTNNIGKRANAHRNNPYRSDFNMEVVATGLTLAESRALEQAGMEYYHTINALNKANNQINSISPKFWGAFKELAKGLLRYGWNRMTDEILYWTGN